MQSPMQAYSDAIASIESAGSGGYSAVGPDVTRKDGTVDRAYGRHQVMGANIPDWTEAATGTRMTPDEFLNNKDAQEQTFNHRFGGYVNKYGNPQDAASAWFTGQPRTASSGAASDILGTTGNKYVDKFNAALANQGGGVPSSASAYAPPGNSITNAFSQGTPKMAQPQDDSIMGKLMSGGPGALFGAPNGVFPGADGAAGGGYDVGHALQGAGAGLTSISNPAGGAAMLNAANAQLFKQRFSVTKDSLGRMMIVDNHTGQVRDANGTPISGGGASGGAAGDGSTPDTATTLASTPVAQEARAKADQEASQKTLEGLRASSVEASQMKSRVQEALALANDPNVHQGAYGGVIGHLKNTLASLTGGAMAPDGTDQTEALGKLFTQIQGQYLSAQKGVRFAGPEIKFSEGANPDLNKPAAVNQQILQDYGRQADLAVQAHDLANAHMKQYGVLGPKFNDALTQLYQQNPSSKLDAVQPSAPPAQSGGGFKVLKVH